MGLDNWIQVESSSIAQVKYKNSNLDVEFKETGKIFRYYGVPSEVFNDLVNSSSIGKHFIKTIKGKFPDSKVEINELESHLSGIKSGTTSVVELSNILDFLLKEGLSLLEIINLSNSTFEEVREAIAYLNVLPEEIVEKLASDKSTEVVRKIAMRKNLNEKTKEILLQSNDSEVIRLITQA